MVVIPRVQRCSGISAHAFGVDERCCELPPCRNVSEPERDGTIFLSNWIDQDLRGIDKGTIWVELGAEWPRLVKDDLIHNSNTRCIHNGISKDPPCSLVELMNREPSSSWILRGKGNYIFGKITNLIKRIPDWQLEVGIPALREGGNRNIRYVTRSIFQ